ncbi:MAG TPA: SOS response-associated peptidase [Polyangia bacterium]|nr:SOS response-associated peptidase [Polyangia bacterium]
MCGRFTLTVPDLDLLAELLGVPADPALAERYRPRYNVAPSDAHLIVAGEKGGRRLVSATWGLGAQLRINARSETARERPTFQRAFARGRCVVPADGFFEWSGPEKARRPLWYRRVDGGLLLMAGLFEPGPAGLRFTILTTPANQLVAQVHDRMPALLAPAQIDAWLHARSAAEAQKLLRPAPEDMLQVTAVSRRLNAVANDDPACLEPDPEPPRRPAKQLRLL